MDQWQNTTNWIEHMHYWTHHFWKRKLGQIKYYKYIYTKWEFTELQNLSQMRDCIVNTEYVL